MKRFIPLLSVIAWVALAGCERSERISSPQSSDNGQPAPTAGMTSAPVASATSPQPSSPPALPSPDPTPPEASAPAGSMEDEVAIIETTKGTMVAEFWPDVAPKTVENFKKLAREGFYDGTSFHRIIKDFMIQGGDPYTKDPAKKDIYGTGGPDSTVDAEFNERKHVLGVLSMARGPNPNSAGSQFFICLGPAASLDRQYTAFGKLIKGEDVLLAIGETPVSPNPRMRGEMSVPNERVEVKSVKIVKRAEVI